MDKELLLKRFVELLQECDEWMMLQTGAEKKYLLEITQKGIAAKFKEEQTRKTYKYAINTIISNERITLPVSNKTGLRVLLTGLLKEFIHPTQIEVELEKRFKNSEIEVWFDDRHGIDIQLTFGSTIDRLNGLGKTTKGNRFITSNTQLSQED